MGTKPQLRRAIVEGDQAVVESLFDEGFGVNGRLQADWTPLHVAANAGQLAMATWLISKGAEVTRRIPSGKRRWTWRFGRRIRRW